MLNLLRDYFSVFFIWFHEIQLWMGDHHKRPNIVENMPEPTNLAQLIQNNPSLVGDNIIQRFGKAKLPFLFKVLSVETALSIQAHPNKEHAEVLNRTNPDVYQDDNHKPEIAIGLFLFIFRYLACLIHLSALAQKLHEKGNGFDLDFRFFSNFFVS